MNNSKIHNEPWYYHALNKNGRFVGVVRAHSVQELKEELRYWHNKGYKLYGKVFRTSWGLTSLKYSNRPQTVKL